VPEILRRREKSSASASITCGEAWCFRGDRLGETRGIIGDGLDVEGEGEALSALSFGLLELRRRIFVKYVTLISSVGDSRSRFSLDCDNSFSQVHGGWVALFALAGGPVMFFLCVGWHRLESRGPCSSILHRLRSSKLNRGFFGIFGYTLFTTV
jgi:hypothetical protein